MVSLLLVLAWPASAHNVLVGCDPVDGATLPTPPDAVELVFDQPVLGGFNTVTVTGPGGYRWERDEEVAVEGASVRQRLHPLGPAGEYTIAYRILSADGHPVSDTLTFTLADDGPGTVPPQPPDAPEDADLVPPGAGEEPAVSGGAPVWVWFAAAGALFVGGLLVGSRVAGPPAPRPRR
ncbi:copper resistance CopC family protein [Actinoalloteichus spitiensis]|uniref:copper resistance CopC family protein n=1 Tax=Actinoalloteichus spitiensis TaxID=252394 RepID=UPI001FE23F17|nr:copper resistance CopC family protein [Actinoalloteichus spitiensis]